MATMELGVKYDPTLYDGVDPELYESVEELVCKAQRLLYLLHREGGEELPSDELVDWQALGERGITRASVIALERSMDRLASFYWLDRTESKSRSVRPGFILREYGG